MSTTMLDVLIADGKVSFVGNEPRKCSSCKVGGDVGHLVSVYHVTEFGTTIWQCPCGVVHEDFEGPEHIGRAEEDRTPDYFDD